MENLKHIEAGLRAAENVWISPRKIWMILEIAAQISANDDVGIKEMLQLKEEADKLFDADGNLKQEQDPDVVEPTEPRKTGWDFGAVKEIAQNGTKVWTNDKYSGQPFFPNPFQYEAHSECLIEWMHSECLIEWMHSGELFISEKECQDYCDYLNSLNDGHS